MTSLSQTREQLERYIAELRLEREASPTLRAAAEIGTVIEEVTRQIGLLPTAAAR